MAVPFHCNHGSKINVIRFSDTFEMCTKVYAAYRCSNASVVVELTLVKKMKVNNHYLISHGNKLVIIVLCT